MLLQVSELFKIVFMFLVIIYICSKWYRFRFYDLVFSIAILIILDVVNTGYINKIYTITGCLAVKKSGDVLRGTDALLLGLWATLFCMQIVMWRKRKKDAYIRGKEQEIEETYGSAYRELVQEIRRKQHEFDNHLIALSGIYKTVSSAEELIREQRMYCEEVNRDNRYNKLLAVPSPVLAGFLYSKFTMAEEQGCDPAYCVELSSLKNLPLSEYCVIEILGILLDNAIEALVQQESRRLYAEISENPGCIRILVKNNSDYIRQDDIRRFVKAGYSTKGNDRGLGLTTVAGLVEKYDGTLRICNEEDNQVNWLVAEIVIPVKRRA